MKEGEITLSPVYDLEGDFDTCQIDHRCLAETVEFSS